jgi:hypothetical protein
VETGGRDGIERNDRYGDCRKLNRRLATIRRFSGQFGVARRVHTAEPEQRFEGITYAEHDDCWFFVAAVPVEWRKFRNALWQHRVQQPAVAADCAAHRARAFILLLVLVRKHR